MIQLLLRLFELGRDLLLRRALSVRGFLYAALVASFSVVFFVPIVLLQLLNKISKRYRDGEGAEVLCSCADCQTNDEYVADSAEEPTHRVHRHRLNHHHHHHHHQPNHYHEPHSHEPHSHEPHNQQTQRANQMKSVRNRRDHAEERAGTVRVAQHEAPSKNDVARFASFSPDKKRTSLPLRPHSEKRKASLSAISRRTSAIRDGSVPPPPPLPGSVHKKFNHPVKLKSFYWNKIHDRVIASSAWGSRITDHNVPIKAEEIHELFKNVVSEHKVTDDDKKNSLVSILEAKKAHNMNILLAQIREVTDEDIRHNVMSGAQGELSKEHLNLLSKFVPSEDEAAAIMSYSGDLNSLGRPEKYFREVLQGNRFVQKLEALVVKSHFVSRVAHLRANITLVEQSAIELTSSDRFLNFLSAILGVGNFLNSGGRLGNACGFQLDSLSKIPDTKIMGGRKNLLHYLVSFVEDYNPDALEWPADLASIHDVAKVPFETLASDLLKLKNDAKKIDHELHGDDAESQGFRNVMQEFEDFAQEDLSDLDEHLTSMHDNLLAMFEFYADDVKKAHDYRAVREWFEMLSNFTNSFKAAKDDVRNEREQAARLLVRAEEAGKRGNDTANTERTNAPAEGKTVLDEIKEGHFELKKSGVDSH